MGGVGGIGVGVFDGWGGEGGVVSDKIDDGVGVDGSGGGGVGAVCWWW